MSEINQNNCNVISLRPLEVTCNPTNATSPETQDGSIQLFINGGTSPYTVTWANGGVGNYIGNLQSGNYVATVTDYYGDYTTTVTCTVGNDTFYLDEFIKCEEEFNPNIFVFYDGTSLNYTTAAQASESIRTWYQTKKNNGFGGLLYEGVVGKENHNAENWLWWSTYPYLGSLTGGTLSDGITEIKSFGLDGQSVNYSTYNSNWCESNDGGKCVPRQPSFNFSTSVAGGLISDIYQRINNGFTLTGAYGSDDVRSMGVPFTVTPSMTGNYETIYGDFIGGDKNYLCIIVSDEADGDTGLYHGNVNTISGQPNKNYLFTNPFALSGTGWSATTQQEPSNRFTHDYESFLKVWEDIKDESGRFEGFIFPVIENNTAEIPYIQHTVAAVEGTTISATTFEDKYNTPITNVGPLSLNLSALTTTNVYSGLTGTTAYTNLNPSYKNGAGLKNFDWQVDPTVSGFQSGVVGNVIDEFFSGISLSSIKFYTSPISGLTGNTIYKFTNTNGCYSYNQRLLSTGQTFSALTVSNIYDSCLKCQPSPPNPIFQPTLCFADSNNQYDFTPSGTDVNNNFVWENTPNTLTLKYNISLNRWEITPWTNIGVGGMVRSVNETIPSGNFINLGNPQAVIWSMTEGVCTGIPLTLNSETSDEVCRGNGNGAVILTADGGYPTYQYRVQNVSPYPTYSNVGIFNGLSSGNYLGEVQDISGNTTSTVFTISQGEIGVNYTVSLTSIVTSSTNGSRTWNYSVQINPSLPVGFEVTMNIKLTHIRKWRDIGSQTFNYSHVITKNGNLNIPYTTTTPLNSNIDTNCSVKPTLEFTQTFSNDAPSITLNSTDTSLNGVVTQTVTIDGSEANCLENCRMLGTYNTTLQVSNLSITGSNCSTVVNANTPIGENITIYDCIAPQT